jgi:hypothetical protein
MSLKDEIRDATEPGSAPHDALEATMLRVGRRARRRRALLIVVPLVLFAGAATLVFEGFGPSDRAERDGTATQGATHTSPSPTPSPTESESATRSSAVTAPVQSDFSVGESIAVGDVGEVNSVAFAFGSVWVAGADRQAADAVFRVEPETGGPQTTINAVTTSWESGGGGLEVTSDSIWTTGGLGGNAIAERIDPRTNRVVQTLSLGAGVGGDLMVFGEDLWVLVNASDRVSEARVERVDLTTGATIASIPLPFSWARQILVADGIVWAYGRTITESGGIGEGMLSRIDPATNTLTSSAAEEFFEYAWDGQTLWAAGFADDSYVLTRISLQTGNPEGAPVLTAPDMSSAGLAPGLAGVWFVGADGKAAPPYVARYNPASDQVDVLLKSDRFGPVDLTASEEAVWLLNYDGTLTPVEISSSASD